MPLCPEVTDRMNHSLLVVGADQHPALRVQVRTVTYEVRRDNTKERHDGLLDDLPAL